MPPKNYSAEITIDGEPFAAPDITSPESLRLLAQECADATIDRRHVVIRFALNHDRPAGFPLPRSKMPNGEPQEYRALAILDFVEYQLDLKSRQARGERDAEGRDVPHKDQKSSNRWDDLV